MDASIVPAERSRAVTLYWARSDRLKWMTIAGSLGLVAAIAMASLGLPPVDLHGPFHRVGIMDPLCGGTRAARLTAQGDLVAAWRYNPLGIVASVAALLAVARLVIGMVTKRWLDAKVAWTPRRWRVVGAISVLLIVALEIRQQGRSELLLQAY